MLMDLIEALMNAATERRVHNGFFNTVCKVSR